MQNRVDNNMENIDKANLELNPIVQGTALPYEILNEQYQNAAYPDTKLQIRAVALALMRLLTRE